MSEICPHCGGTGIVPERPEHVFRIGQTATLDTIRTGTVTIPIDPPVTLDAGTYLIKLDGGRVTFERVAAAQRDGEVER